MSPDDPLQALEVDANEVDRAMLAGLVKDYVSIDRSTGRFLLKPEFAKLDAKNKIIKYLLGRKARTLRDPGAEEGALAKEIIQEVGLPSGTVHPRLKDLKGNRVISQGTDKRYFVPNWSLAALAGQD